MRQRVKLLCKFLLKSNAKETAHELRIGHDTVVKWFDYVRRNIQESMQQDFYPNFHFYDQFAIEWDEAAICKRLKFDRGGAKPPVWVLHGVQHSTKYIAWKYVPERDALTLQSFIAQHS